MSRKYHIVCNVHYLLFSAFSLFSIIQGAPVTNAGEAAAHLIQYHYLAQPAPGESSDISAFGDALIQYQAAGQIPQTGILDDATLELMSTPRCGNVDNPDTSGDRSKRYAIQSEWDYKDLTWDIRQYTEDVSALQLDDAISTALKFWADASGLTFTRDVDEDSTPDFVILFPEPYVEHGDGIPFDGKGNVLAHAFFPGSGSLSGDAHFDDSETWTVKSSLGTNILAAATHEFGHSIGLSHSLNYSSVMWPWIKPYNPNFRLGQDDIDGVQFIYGAPSHPNPATRPPVVDQQTVEPSQSTTTTAVDDGETKPTLASIPSNCQVEFDTITVGIDGGTYAFKGKYYWQIINGKVYMPKLISNTWPNLPANLDAAVTVKNSYIWKGRVSKTYFFKGRQVYRYTLYTLDMGFPVDLSWEFSGFPDDLTGFDAVVEGIGNGQTYFFIGNQFYIYDYTENISGPFSITSFKGIPSSIVAGVQWTDNYLYLFTSVGWYYQFSPWTFNVNLGYPRLTVQDWFGCGASLQEGQSQSNGSATDETIPGLDVDNSGSRRIINFLTIFISFLLFIMVAGVH